MSKKMNGEGDGQSPIPVIAYLRVSTDEQGRSGLGLAAQREAINQASVARGWEVVEWIEDTASGKSLEREGVQHAIEMLEDDGPSVLVAAKQDRISRSFFDYAQLMKRAEDNGWELTALDLPEVDMTTPEGKLVARIMASAAEYERDKIIERTKAALAEAKKRGVRIGRPPGKLGQLSPATVDRIRRDRDRGASLATIADELNRDGIRTVTGKGRWYASSVKLVLDQRVRRWDDRR